MLKKFVHHHHHLLRWLISSIAITHLEILSRSLCQSLVDEFQGLLEVIGFDSIPNRDVLTILHGVVAGHSGSTSSAAVCAQQMTKLFGKPHVEKGRGLLWCC